LNAVKIKNSNQNPKRNKASTQQQGIAHAANPNIIEKRTVT